MDPRHGRDEVARRNRRGDEPAEEHLDELDEGFDDAIDDDTDEAPVSGRGGTATKARPRTGSGGGKSTKTKERPTRLGIFGWIGRFFREVVAELRKVIWPNRKELRNYTVVVVVFVAVMLTIVGLLDLGFARAVLWVFGD
jgi:preprotein translocase subunit SecE